MKLIFFNPTRRGANGQWLYLASGELSWLDELLLLTTVFGPANVHIEGRVVNHPSPYLKRGVH